MRILLLHNTYLVRGGEEQAVEYLRHMLERRGHAVDAVIEENGKWYELGAFRKALSALSTPFSIESARLVRKKIEEFRPDVVHVHNIFPFLSPSVYWAAKRAGVPVVQTFHNFRWFCMNGLLLREGKICELCIGGNPVHGVVHACYQGSRAKSTLIASTLLLHRVIGTWRKRVAAYIALSEFSRGKYIEAGFPADRIRIIRNGADGPSAPKATVARAPGFLYVGRLSSEKGFSTLLEAYRLFVATGAVVPLHVAGAGPLAVDLERFCRENPSLPVVFHGLVNAAQRTALFEKSSHLIFPSECYENSPLVVLESLAAGLPVIAARIGGIPELVQAPRNGALFNAGDVQDLTRQMRLATEQNAAWPQQSDACRADGQRHFEDWITGTEAVYREVSERSAQKR